MDYVRPDTDFMLSYDLIELETMGFYCCENKQCSLEDCRKCENFVIDEDSLDGHYEGI